MPPAPSAPDKNDPRLRQVTAAARALAGLISTARMYQVQHPAFQRAVEQQLAALAAAMDEAGEVVLYFADQQIRHGALALEPESGLMRTTAKWFEDRGVKGISLLPGLTAAELASFAGIMLSTDRNLETSGLTLCLEHAGIRHILEQKVKYGIIGRERVVYPPTAGSGPAAKAGSTPPAPVAAKTAAPTAAKTPTPAGASLKSWDLEAETTAGTRAVPPRLAGQKAVSSARRPLRDFVHSVFDAVSKNEATPPQAADIIAAEIETRIEEKADEVRAEQEGRIRRLEQVKDVLLEELDDLHLAALLIDPERRVVAMNKAARDLLGLIDKLQDGSPLDQFIRSGKERQTVELPGASRLAHMIIAPDAGEGNLMLVCLE
ncbi:MAG TPA: hypothetical protein P5567_15385 [Kiritimatiellia bacterium]|nr:hypothetical protein [Kiritimatiellia bacterium]HRZ13825.1 hypothetical protein [Kiritimatiellia bacterium]HSA19446.1 hypothetical protein [Kiritimatiellia bacterium]